QPVGSRACPWNPGPVPGTASKPPLLMNSAWAVPPRERSSAVAAAAMARRMVGPPNRLVSAEGRPSAANDQLSADPVLGFPCSPLLQRMENQDLTGFTSVHLLADVAHKTTPGRRRHAGQRPDQVGQFRRRLRPRAGTDALRRRADRAPGPVGVLLGG